MVGAIESVLARRRPAARGAESARTGRCGARHDCDRPILLYTSSPTDQQGPLPCEHRSFIVVAAFVAVLIVGAVAAYAYDSSNEDKIANGVTVAGVDVGGLSAARPRSWQRELAEPLERPSSVTARQAALHPLGQGRRAEARTSAGWSTRRSTRAATGNMISRVTRDVTGGEEDVRRAAAGDLLQARPWQELVQARRRRRGQARPGRQAELPGAHPGQGAGPA